MTNSTRPPMRIAMMIESVGLGGAEMVVLHLANELRSRGHQVLPVVPDVPEGWLLDALRASGFSWFGYRGRGPLDFALMRQLTEALRAFGATAIHSHEFVMTFYGTVAGRRLRIPHVATLHADQHMTAVWRRRLALRWAIERSAAVVAVSTHTREHLESRLSQPPGRLYVVANGIPDVQGDPAPVRAEFGVGARDVVLLAMGSLVLRKGHAQLIEALASLRGEQDLPPWRLLIAGDGVERASLLARIASHGLGDRIKLLGRRQDGANLRAAAHVLCMPSLWEGMPLAILEGMFAANAVVASAASGIPEVLTDGVDGLLVEPGNVPALAGALRTVLRDPDLRTRLGAAAQQRARREFTIGAMTDAYENLYRLEAGGPNR